jgi:preprotein translocase subunit YajC
MTSFLLLSTTLLLQDTAAPGGGLTRWLVLYVGIFALFYFLIMRPQQRQRKAHDDRLRQVKRGDEVVTAGGVIGEVVHIKEGVTAGAPTPTLEDRITIKSADTRMVVERRAITRILTPRTAEEEKPT